MYFVHPSSIVRKIWGSSDTILFIFAGAAAEFALNKAVDWLYFTGRLPSDPLGRLFSTVNYSRRIVFSKTDEAYKAIDQISSIHKAVEESRGSRIPMWAYRDVLYMLIDYSVRAFEVIERKLTDIEKLEVYDVFYRMGSRMKIEDLPSTYGDWLLSREQHLNEDLILSEHTIDLFKKYKIHLGPWRYSILLQSQAMVIPEKVKRYLNLYPVLWIRPAFAIYTSGKRIPFIKYLKDLMLPVKYRKQINDLDKVYKTLSR
jgi:hypothetical protein